MNKDHEKLNKKLEHQLELNSINDELLKSCPKNIAHIDPHYIITSNFGVFNKKTKNQILLAFSKTHFYKSLSLLEKAIYTRHISS